MRNVISLGILCGLFAATAYLFIADQSSKFEGATDRSDAAVERMEASKARVAALLAKPLDQ